MNRNKLLLLIGLLIVLCCGGTVRGGGRGEGGACGYPHVERWEGRTATLTSRGLPFSTLSANTPALQDVAVATKKTANKLGVSLTNPCTFIWEDCLQEIAIQDSVLWEGMLGSRGVDVVLCGGRQNLGPGPYMAYELTSDYCYISRTSRTSSS